MPSSASETFSLKVSRDFAKRYRSFCDEQCLQIGKFTEQALEEIMEDHYFGLKAQRVLATSAGATRDHESAFDKKTK